MEPDGGEPETIELRDVEESWPVRASQDIHRDDWVVALRSDEVTAPGQQAAFNRLVVEHPGAVAVLAVDAHDHVVVLRQYRHPVQQRLVELPAGLLDAPGEDPLATARRELAEEAGLAADDWTVLLDVVTSPGILSETVRIYLATGLTDTDPPEGYAAAQEEAVMTVHRVPIDQLKQAVLAGRVRHALVVAAVLAYSARQEHRSGAE